MFQRFRQQFLVFPIITLRDIYKSFPDFDTKNLINWQKKGYLVKLRNGYYILTETKTDEFRLYQIANKLYEPSYISLESALNYYGIIPEGVYKIQSVSTRKTGTFTTSVVTFNYRSIKKELYFGYQLATKNNCTYRIASREKAVLDFLYLRSDINDYLNFDSLRWNREELQQICEKTLNDYLCIYNSPVLNKKVKFLKTYLNASY
jgi:predicted transcriptional regulator of viral defense system